MSVLFRVGVEMFFLCVFVAGVSKAAYNLTDSSVWAVSGALFTAAAFVFVVTVLRYRRIHKYKKREDFYDAREEVEVLSIFFSWMKWPEEEARRLDARIERERLEKAAEEAARQGHSKACAQALEAIEKEVSVDKINKILDLLIDALREQQEQAARRLMIMEFPAAKLPPEQGRDLFTKIQEDERKKSIESPRELHNRLTRQIKYITKERKKIPLHYTASMLFGAVYGDV